ncbi:DUF2306 domain-containing protein [Salinisphaera sp. G21_0]|uniref:DUF2306 domain-containing protein n=1 Tax=Salinisphaera sp. G21_0 TaxID=2821094 RepID=UPI001ADD4D3D|nr:DUF2306 domain-containing protein [Salinisphaera sp. G21_0]MBO9483247.1 DUF2306 domain-containing protein [Salinisphaera sp. G21_0]
MQYLGYTSDFAVVSHIALALASIILGAIILLLKKGGRLHRRLGHLWVAMVSLVAIGSFWIKVLNPNSRLYGLSAVHSLSFATLVFLALGIYFARRRKIHQHEFCMKLVFYFGLLLAGTMTLFPGRMLSYYLFNLVHNFVVPLLSLHHD